jgi:hypothetical protein
MENKKNFENPYKGMGRMELAKQLGEFDEALKAEKIAGIRSAYKREARNVLFAKIDFLREEIDKCYKKMERDYDYSPKKKGGKK